MTTSPPGLLHHPKLCQMMSYGFNDCDQTFAALLVYLNLTEVKQWCSVTITPCDQLQMISLMAKKFDDDHPLCILPLPTSQKLSMESIFTYSEALMTKSSGSQLTLGLVDSDSTISFYQLSSGLSPPPSNVTWTQKK